MLEKEHRYLCGGDGEADEIKDIKAMSIKGTHNMIIKTRLNNI